MNPAAIFIVVIFLSMANPGFGAGTEIRIPKTKADTPNMPNYFPEKALRLALEKTAPNNGEVNISYLNGEYTPQRLRTFLMNTDQLDVMWSTTTRERESQMLPIRFNILRGINEYRKLLIHSDLQKKFEKVNTIDDLRHLTAGVGLYWSDADVLTENDLPHIVSPTYETTIKMLAAKRFEYVIRGAHEIDDETERYKNLNLIAEQNIYIHYCLPVYFFVKKGNLALAERIRTGLELAEADGSLNELFLSVPVFKQVFKETHPVDPSKTLIELKNQNCDAPTE